jgi:hypothetical protein
MPNLKSPPPRIDEEILSEDSQRSGVWPALVNVFQEQGYEAGYARGASDALATLLEAIEDFAKTHPGSPADTRRLLYAFSEFLERRLPKNPPNHAHEFVDGLGI